MRRHELIFGFCWSSRVSTMLDLLRFFVFVFPSCECGHPLPCPDPVEHVFVLTLRKRRNALFIPPMFTRPPRSARACILPDYTSTNLIHSFSFSDPSSRYSIRVNVLQMVFPMVSKVFLSSSRSI
ncbi:hypothetical protein FIBSPDRAFT_398817 [Athelia psychrophila]|uniref:Secreted protein n=1 Tax=Athelia psychrophila TaxID=1759441 RepID=A0A166NDU1_9AGAM|nr:hypothetical protein FIBSPDRAFT_398817 [Fibularhizoctonia sp. CBS 109695]